MPRGILLGPPYQLTTCGNRGQSAFPANHRDLLGKQRFALPGLPEEQSILCLVQNYPLQSHVLHQLQAALPAVFPQGKIGRVQLCGKCAVAVKLDIALGIEIAVDFTAPGFGNHRSA